MSAKVFSKKVVGHLHRDVIRLVLREMSLNPAVSADENISTIERNFSNKNLINKLIDYSHESNRCLNKCIRIYSLVEPFYSMAKSTFDTYSKTKKTINSEYPFKLNQLDLAKENNDYNLVDSYINSHGAGFVFSKKRIFENKVEYNPNQLTLDTRKQFPNADKIIEIKNQLYQTLDVVFFNDSNKTIEVRVDINRPSKIQSKEQVSNSLFYFDNFFKGIVTNLLSHLKVVDFFPALKEIYESPVQTSPVVRKIGFLTDEMSVKNESVTDKDIRDEIYHKYGKEALDKGAIHIHIFRMEFLWEKKINIYKFLPAVVIEGKGRELMNQSSVFIDACMVKNTVDSDMLKYTTDELFKYL